MEAIKTNLTGKAPDYIRGYLDALKAAGKLSDADAQKLLTWATEAAMRRIVTGPLGESPLIG